ncbi:sensor histidine kinase [Colwellia hornerae]|uniref:histidine kinase n=1 Tax=Colwellia hornerae TaxID=89402 RepID=A0A5C6Q2J7_9GAMM|nr:GAF domain-containing sensor histidine kinase [Colwellia hornerae]TWX46364.1 GAF domain-containing sensor histidine kinase [Colwellia hornerae]TWX54014.1 GAF domain-containing sensor histidine kinase [Colwellia hornerae]TWX63053.1 GAF domain-containing sensor histidine kinase [Colwellia hornerae]
MISALIPDNESARLAALDEYNILDTPVEQTYDQLTELVSSICGTPIVLISFIDEKRQWFKSHYGLEVEETPRDIAFCAHAIHQEEVFEIPDSRKDKRFHDNPLVTGSAQVIFYAGAPLVTPDGLRLGTLCAIDNKPSQLTDIQKQQLTIIAQQVVAHLELRKVEGIKESLVRKSLSLTNTLAAKNKELEQFVFAVSHDLKSPLVTINGFTSTLAKELIGQTTEKQQHRFSRILKNVKNMADLLTNLLELSRVMKGEITKVPHDVTSLIEKSWQRLLTKNRVLNVEFILSKPLHSILTHQPLFSQCVDNLLNNAIKYRSSERNLQLKIHTEESDTAVSLFINDNGTGIGKKDHKRIFHVFEQIVEGEGTGIGLTIVKAVMDKHTGLVELVSEVDQGCRFELRFPKV